jgi:hypothetical protein
MDEEEEELVQFTAQNFICPSATVHGFFIK